LTPPTDPPTDPLDEFRTALAAAAAAGEAEAGTAMALATVDSDGSPSVRIVLLKSADARGFSFFTNYRSRKGREIEATGRAALCFYWPSLERQVRVEGRLERLPAAESDAYFASRPRGSQLGAWASLQSEPLPARAALEQRLAEVTARFAGAEVTRPPFWGGYLLAPQRLELWQGRADRLHDRIVYTRTLSGWSREALYP
jgi:pyridoxamine 5'-phosphate oxidase